MTTIVKSDYQNKYVLLALFKDVLILFVRAVWFCLKGMAIGWAIATVMTTKPRKYDLLTKVVVGSSGLALLRRSLRTRKPRAYKFKL